MKYEHIPCEKCNEVFREGDDVVVCPVCGTPHHRSCWQETGHCINRDKHSPSFAWENPLPNDAEPLTANPNPAEKTIQQQAQEAFMRLYGFRPLSPDDKIGDVEIQEYSSFIGTNAHKYIPKFYKMQKLKRKISWNWVAFFFPIPWLFYRKMFALGAFMAFFYFAIPIVFATDVVEYVQSLLDILFNLDRTGLSSQDIASVLPPQPFSYSVSDAIQTAVRFACFLFGDYWYMQRSSKNICAMRTKKLEGSNHLLALKRKGGVSVFKMLIGLFCVYAVYQAAISVALRTGYDISSLIQMVINYFR
ncbi:MAG: DUF2628 domain-containing protein [Oscillospiraceae bacterium]|nr:DUF2628 domain-containing protein [Oscillospiraceae bacterium]